MPESGGQSSLNYSLSQDLPTIITYGIDHAADQWYLAETD
jgi:hypothetical protein